MARWTYPTCALLALATCVVVVSRLRFTTREEVCLCCGRRTDTRWIDFCGRLLSRSVTSRPSPVAGVEEWRTERCGHDPLTLQEEVSSLLGSSIHDMHPARWGVHFILDRPLGWRRMSRLDPETASGLLYLHTGTRRRTGGVG